MSLAGFYEELANDPEIRSHVLEVGQLYRWSAASAVGVINQESLALNESVINRCLHFWCSQWTGPKSLPVRVAKNEASKHHDCASACVCVCSSTLKALFYENQPCPGEDASGLVEAQTRPCYLSLRGACHEGLPHLLASKVQAWLQTSGLLNE